MASYGRNKFESVPTDTGTSFPGPVARWVDFLAGPLALGASGLTFFMAYTLTVPSPSDLRIAANPVSSTAGVPSAAPAALPVTGMSKVSQPGPAVGAGTTISINEEPAAPRF